MGCRPLVSLINIALVLAASPGCAKEDRIPDEAALKRATDFAKALRLSSTTPKVFRRSEKSITVAVGTVRFTFSGVGGELQTVTNAWDGQQVLGPPKPLPTDETVWSAGDRVIAALRLPTYPRSQIGARPGWKKIYPHIRFCTFKEVVDGYTSDDNGNCMTMLFDNRNGNLIDLIIGAGFTYNRPKSKITSERAVAIARAQEGSRSLSKKPQLTYALGNASTSKIGAMRRDAKQMRLVYRVVLKGATVDVDAQTGDILGVYFHRP